jgi:hypothetical protein
MKKLLIYIFCFSLLTKSFGQTKSNCDCGAIIDINYKNEISIFDKPNGTIIQKLKHDFEKEDYLTMTILKDSSDYYKVNISYSIKENSNVIGWLNKDNNIGTFTKNYSPKERINLYTEPNKKSKVKTNIQNWTNQLYIIEKCNEKWVYVRIKYKGKNKEGWLEPEMQCNNPYSTCN